MDRMRESSVGPFADALMGSLISLLIRPLVGPLIESLRVPSVGSSIVSAGDTLMAPTNDSANCSSAGSSIDSLIGMFIDLLMHFLNARPFGCLIVPCIPRLIA